MNVFLLVLALLVAVFLRGRGRRDLRLRIVEHLATLTARGLPLGPGLVALARERGARWGRRARRDALAIRGIAERLEATASVAEALASQPRIFSKDAVALVRAAEARGALPDAFAVLLAEEKDGENFSMRLVERGFYPLALAFLVLAFSTFLVLFTEPKLAETVEVVQAGTLPANGVAVVATSSLAVLLLLSTFAVSVLVAGGRSGQALLGLGARIACVVPVLATPVRRLLHARWMARAGALLAAGATLPEALAGVAERGVFARRLARAAKNAAEGQPLQKILAGVLGRDAELVAPILLATRAEGLPAALASTARRLSDRSVRRLEAFSQALRPVPVMLLALVVGTHAWAVWSAIIQVQDSLNGSFKP
jgi:general secretion pathway protein F